MIKPILVLMIGVPGAGKSTWAKNCSKIVPHLFPEPVSIVSRDEIRFNLVKEGEPYFSKESLVFNTWINNIADALNKREGVVIADATHLNAGSRFKTYNAVKARVRVPFSIVGVVIDSTLEDCINNNELRKGTRAYVPVSAIESMADAFSYPEEPFFDKIYCFKGGKK